MSKTEEPATLREMLQRLVALAETIAAQGHQQAAAGDSYGRHAIAMGGLINEWAAKQTAIWAKISDVNTTSEILRGAITSAKAETVEALKHKEAAEQSRDQAVVVTKIYSWALAATFVALTVCFADLWLYKPRVEYVPIQVPLVMVSAPAAEPAKLLPELPAPKRVAQQDQAKTTASSTQLAKMPANPKGGSETGGRHLAASHDKRRTQPTDGTAKTGTPAQIYLRPSPRAVIRDVD